MTRKSTGREWTEWARRLNEIEDPSWLPPEVDLERPSIARVYDYALGGKTNFDIDRSMFRRIESLFSRARQAAEANRTFMHSAVRHMAAQGITQFIDFGAGIPRSPNVHEVAREIQPEARVVYLEKDPMAVAHGQAFLATDDRLAVGRLDFTAPDKVYRHPDIQRLIDFREPVALLFLAVLHFVQHDVSLPLVYNYRRRLAPGSMIAVSVAGIRLESGQRADMTKVDEMDSIADTLRTRFVLRTPAQVEHLVEDFELVEPGVVNLQDWPEPSGSDFLYAHAAVARVPTTS